MADLINSARSLNLQIKTMDNEKECKQNLESFNIDIVSLKILNSQSPPEKVELLYELKDALLKTQGSPSLIGIQCFLSALRDEDR